TGVGVISTKISAAAAATGASASTTSKITTTTSTTASSGPASSIPCRCSTCERLPVTVSNWIGGPTTLEIDHLWSWIRENYVCGVFGCTSVTHVRNENSRCIKLTLFQLF